MAVEAPTPHEPKVFPTTIWSHVRSARDGDAGKLQEILVRYRAPIVAFLRRKGVAADLCEDLAQEVLLRLSRREFLDRIDPALGRFRSLLVAVTRRVLSEELRRERALRRGGAARVVRAGDLGSTSLSLEHLRVREDPVFDQIWVRELVESALAALEADSKKRGLPLADAFRLKYVEGLSQEDVAARLGAPVANAKNHIYYGKLRFKEFLLASIKDYCATPQEYEDELRRLAPYLKASAT